MLEIMSSSTSVLDLYHLIEENGIVLIKCNSKIEGQTLVENVMDYAETVNDLEKVPLGFSELPFKIENISIMFNSDLYDLKRAKTEAIIYYEEKYADL